MENKPKLLDGFLLFSFICLILLVILLYNVVAGDSCQAQSCGAETMPTVVKGEHYEWTYDDEIGKLIREADHPKSEKSPEKVGEKSEATKAEIVANIISKEIKRDNYTIRVGLEGRMKPIPHLSGNTKDERAKSLLDTVGKGHTLPIWKKFGEKYGIDYTLPIAIGFADSHLGKALKSKNNIGNVGNDDRGRTREYETLEAGIEAIFWSLAHGKYMSGHNTIGTLSGEGRKRLGLPGCAEEKDYRKKCYASSMGNWSTNTTNAMSAIHNKEIREDYNFRLGT